jgi:PKD repeat protein
MHKPCLTIGVYTCEPGAELLNLFLAKKVDLVLSGHEHGYQRTHQLRHSPNCPAVIPGTFSASCVGDSDSTFNSGAGTVFGIVGTGGVDLRDNNPADGEAGYMAATSGSNQNPTYGPLDVVATPTSMRADFLRAAGGTFTDGFTLTKDAQTPNESPAASFDSSCAGLTCTVDGSGSSDTDGTIASYAWDFGDGATASGATASHTYAVAGTYTIRLTVTDDDVSTGITTRVVTATAPTTGVTYASDDFSRTVTSGFGTAPVGGTWTHSTTLTNFSVTGGQGQMRTANGSEPKAYLAAVSATQVDLRTRVSLDKLPIGGSNYITVLGRRTQTAGSYAVQVVIRATGATTVELTRVPTSGSAVTMQGQTSVPGAYAVGDSLNIRLQVTGSAPTTIRVKVWKVGTIEPTNWQRSVTDTTPAMQASGSVGITNYLSSGATNSPLLLRVDDLTVTQP